MKLGVKINDKFKVGMGIINQAKLAKEAIDDDRWLESSTKQNRKQITDEQTAEKIKAIRNQIHDEALQGIDYADKSFKRAIKADSETLAKVGSTLGPILATKTNDELLTLYENRFHNKAERCLIESYISANIDSKKPEAGFNKLEPVADPIRTKLQAIFDNNVDRLSDKEKDYYNELQLERQKADFAINAAEALRIEMKDLEGKLPPSDVDLIRRVDALSAIQKYNENGGPYGDR